MSSTFETATDATLVIDSGAPANLELQYPVPAPAPTSPPDTVQLDEDDRDPNDDPTIEPSSETDEETVEAELRTEGPPTITVKPVVISPHYTGQQTIVRDWDLPNLDKEKFVEQLNEIKHHYEKYMNDAVEKVYLF
ncbi:MAG TPA: hypothetical protein VFV08_04425, partial [Puia sp.]|nr:hypothetical protein [Puia sp.]